MMLRCRFRHAPSRSKEDERRAMIEAAKSLLAGIIRDREEEARRRVG